MLVRDLSHELLQEVLQRHDPRDRPPLVDDDGEVLAAAAEVGEEGRDRLRLGREEDGPGERAGVLRQPRRPEGREDVLDVDDADRLLDASLDERDPGVLRPLEEPGDLREGRVRLRDDHVGARRHHLADRPVAEVDGSGDELLVVLLEDPLLARDVEEGPHVRVLLGLLLGGGDRLLLLLRRAHEPREERVEGGREEEDDRDEPGEVLEEVLGAAPRDGADDDGLHDEPPEEDRDRRDEERLGDGEAGEPRAEREEPGEDRPLRRQADCDAGDEDVLGREELPVARLLPLEERAPPDRGEALEGVREGREDRVEADERRGKEEREPRPDREVRHGSSSGTPSGPGPKTRATRRRWSRNIAPSSVSWSCPRRWSTPCARRSCTSLSREWPLFRACRAA